MIRKSSGRAKVTQAINYLFIALFVLLFALARYPFYKYFPIPLPIVADGSEYYHTYKEMLEGTPIFHIITPGYPSFIYLVHEFFSEKGIALYVGQSVVTLLAALFFLLTIFKYYRQCLVPVSIALILFFCQDIVLRFETASFPQPLMIATALFFFAFLIRLLDKPTHINMLLLSLSVVYLILLKSSQIFVLPIAGLIVCYFFLVNKRKVALWILVYTGLPLLLYAGYNYRTFKSFTIIASGILDEQAQKRKKLTKQQQDFLYKVGSHFPAWHPIYQIHHSNDTDSLHNAYLICRWGSLLEKDTATRELHLRVIFEMNETVNIDSLVSVNPAFTEEEREWYESNKESITGVKVYLYSRSDYKKMKMFALNFLLNIRRDSPLFYYSEIGWRYENFYVTRAWAKRYDLSKPAVAENLSFLLREMYDPALRDMIQYNMQYERMRSDFYFRLYDILNLKIIKPLSRNIFWLFIFALLGNVVFIRFLFNHRNAHLLFLLTLILFYTGSCLLHAIWGIPLSRYSYATEFVLYLLPALMPLLFMSKKN